MSSVFIVRPFGNRPIIVKDANGQLTTTNYDFEKVDEELLKPAIRQLNLTGGTTGEIFEAGDIREDMFSALLLADLVIADITIHNANVYYELGIRHALRDQKTVIIRCPGYDEVPFDIHGFRYITYEKDDPGSSLPQLVRAIKDTLDDDRKDSPVFNVLPDLESQDAEKYFALPKDFVEEVDVAKRADWPGKLVLLAAEGAGFPWKNHAYRLIGEALYNMSYYRSARDVWEELRQEKADDLLANDRLATIYQRLGEDAMKIDSGQGEAFFARSDQAVETIIGNKSVRQLQRAEAYALKARNAKTKWLYSWKTLPPEYQQKAALQSIFLEEAYDSYSRGFSEDLNHYYSGLNALGLLTVILQLAQRDMNSWQASFVSDKEAERKLQDHKDVYQWLLPAVSTSITCAKHRAEQQGVKDVWALLSEADLLTLTGNNAEKVRVIYRAALQLAQSLNKDASVRQLRIFEILDVKADNMRAALSNFDPISVQEGKPVHTFLFSGHMIDRPGRATPRFPPSKEAEVRDKLRSVLIEQKSQLPENAYVFGIAGGACGGDILFHEICNELSIPSRIHLALPEDQLIVQSVGFAGPGWIDRFHALLNEVPHYELSDKGGLPKWLKDKPGYDVFRRNNLWELNSALVYGGMNMTLIALWDGQPGDGPGGTADMVNEAQARGAKVIVIDL